MIRIQTHVRLDLVPNQSFQASNNADSDPNREAPPKGGVGGWENSFGGGNTGGYNSFYADMFSYHSVIDGKIRTSIIYEPENGKRPVTA